MFQIVMLRGINLGPNRRVPMAELRKLLTDADYEDVRTYAQSGNIVIRSDAKPDKLGRDAERLISDHFGFDVPAIVRTQAELAQVVERNPLAKVADNPKRYQVSFLSGEVDGEIVKRLRELAAEQEAVEVHGREIYAWHPEGVARSKLWNELAGKRLGVAATARNWATVTALLELASEG